MQSVGKHLRALGSHVDTSAIAFLIYSVASDEKNARTHRPHHTLHLPTSSSFTYRIRYVGENFENLSEEVKRTTTQQGRPAAGFSGIK